ncbi:methionine import ATP-binding protein MetN 1 [Striga asiatica]|uniref:Methionine import ATP-binding protein MetN 1 n=1 Tax=Striga asiatica TaxID=4170 RepID=A0A5A7R7Y5_STRAF|nr:methionine import ATP-binding protein MetN 1 [Striga asiatica]
MKSSKQFHKLHSNKSNSSTVEQNFELPLLAGGIPNLSLDDLIIDADAARSEFNAYGGLGLEAELIPSKSGQQIGFADAGVADQDQLEEIIVVVVRPVSARHLQSALYLTQISRELLFFIFEFLTK